MATDTADLLALHRGATDEVQRLIDAVTPDQLDDPTPCGDWDVRALVGHLIAGNRSFASAASGGSLRSAFNAVADEWDASAYAESVRQAADAWSGADAPQGDGAAMPLTVHTIECVVHGWDLARATGQHASFSTEVLDAVEPFAHKMMPAERPAGSGFGPVREAGAGASRLDRFAAFYGRAV